MTPEGRVKKKVKAVFKRYGVYSFMPVQAGRGAPGLDFHAVHHGYAICVETKAPGKEPTPRQSNTIEKMRAAGAEVMVIYDDIGVSLLEAWLIATCATAGCTRHPMEDEPKSEVVTLTE